MKSKTWIVDIPRVDSNGHRVCTIPFFHHCLVHMMVLTSLQHNFRSPNHEGLCFQNSTGVTLLFNQIYRLRTHVGCKTVLDIKTHC